MRYLGNKSKLLSFIDSVIEKYGITGDVFADVFAGTGSVGDYFKGRYRLIGNDYMYYSKVISGAKFLNQNKPEFGMFVEKYGIDPFTFYNDCEFLENDSFFVLHNLTPRAERMFFTESNALRIDGIRQGIENDFKRGFLTYNEYLYLLASLLESVLKVSNTSGTYQAFFNFWESRSLKKLILEPLEMNEINSEIDLSRNVIFNEDTNMLCRRIEGDIVYIDPPYTTNQYANSYHVLETIARYDYPELFGKTGRRVNRTLSRYSNKQMVFNEFEDLFRQLNFRHVLVSYSNQSIVNLDELVNLASKFSINGVVHVEKKKYREYSTNNPSYKDDGSGLKEAIIYFEKDTSIIKSPLNYSGSKDKIIPNIIINLPKHIGTFVDAMGGAFNVGANVVAMHQCIYNEYNPFVWGVVNMLCSTPKDKIVNTTKKYVSDFKLVKKDKESYLRFRDFYNEHQSPEVLFTLQIYAFQNIIRFNSKMQFNTPIGNNEYNPGTEFRILNFRPKTSNTKFIHGRYQDIDITTYPSDTLFYFDPPYFITTAEYNDGKRGLDGWDETSERNLLSFLKKIDDNNQKFLLSNVISHNGKEHQILKDWVAANGYRLIVVGTTGIKYPRTEVLICNYEIEEGY